MTPTEIISKVKNLPPVSQAALKLVTLLEHASISNEEVVQVIKCDNVLTAKLLRACNSPYFGLSEPVASVDQAVLILGHQQILHIVLTLAFGSTMIVPLPGYAAEAAELWQHSLVTANAAEIVAAEAYGLEIEGAVAFTVGLLHDIGKLALSQALTAEQKTAIQARITNENISRSAAEKLVIGTDHGDVGAALLQSWRLPANVIEAVGQHHRPPLDPPKLSAITHIANCLAHRVNPLPDESANASNVDPQVAAALNFDDARLEGMLSTLREAAADMSQMMALN